MLNYNYYSGHTFVVKLFFVLLIELCLVKVKCQQNQVALNVPKSYICGYRDKEKTLFIDGDINENGWEKAKWTDLFTDIQGEIRPKPYLDTKVKMLWDDDYFYIAAEIMESHIWATFDKQDMIIFHENNFEVFIDPDGDTHNYMEMEINALGTVWDLLLTKPYREFGHSINAYELKGLKKAVKIFGTLNSPSDRDNKWTVELAIPWSTLGELNVHKGPPLDGEFWKINFSRVEWDLDIKDAKYFKQKDRISGKDKPENNWVWSPQGEIAMHKPEMWGLVVFSKFQEEKYLQSALEADRIKMKLRQIYFQQQSFFSKHGIYTSNVSTDLSSADVEIKVVGDTYTAKYCKGRSCWYIREDGRIWEKKK